MDENDWIGTSHNLHSLVKMRKKEEINTAQKKWNENNDKQTQVMTFYHTCAQIGYITNNSHNSPVSVQNLKSKPFNKWIQEPGIQQMIAV